MLSGVSYSSDYDWCICYDPGLNIHILNVVSTYFWTSIGVNVVSHWATGMSLVTNAVTNIKLHFWLCIQNQGIAIAWRLETQ